VSEGTASGRAVAGVVDRPRLNRLLDARSPSLCVLRGASGAGKTTLLRDWVAARTGDEPLVWLSVTRPVTSRHAFWILVAEAAKRNGDISQTATAALVERIAASADPVESAIDFLRDVGPVTLVFDAYEQLGAVAEDVDADLLRLTDELPAVRVIVATRGSTRLAADPLLIRDRVRLIDDRQLALTIEETAELLRVHLDRDDLDLARSAVAATSGYALGVRALILALASRAAVPAEDSGEWRELVATDLRSLLPDEAAARFVGLTSVPPYFDRELAVRISGRTDVTDLLATLERQGFGRWIPYARDHPVFQYVDSIRDAFAGQLRRNDRAGYRRGAAAAARWLFEYGDYEPAFALAVQAEDYELASRIYVDVLRVHPESYTTDRLLRQLAALPRRVLAAHPVLAFALGLARMANPLARTTAPEAFRLAAVRHPDSEILGRGLDRFVLDSVRAVSLRLIGRFADSGRRSLEAIEELNESVVEAGSTLDGASAEFIAMILRQLSYSLLQGGRYPEALTTMAQSATTTRMASTRNYALAYLAGAYGFLGEPRAAQKVVAEIDPQGWPRNHERSYLNTMRLVGEGFARLDDHDFEGALELARTAFSYSELAEFWPFVTSVSVHARLGLGEPLSEARRVEALLSAPFAPPGAGDNPATRSLLNLLAISWLAAGRPAKAQRILAGQRLRHAEVVPARLLQLILADGHAQAAERLPRWISLPTHTPRSKAATLLLGAAAVVGTNERLALTLARDSYDHHLTYGVGAHLVFLPGQARQELTELARRHQDEPLAAYLAVDLPDAIATADESSLLATMTRRERIVLAALVRHGSRAEIAQALTVSPNTVKTQLRSIYRKLGVTTREAALQVAAEHDLLEPSLDLPVPRRP
jgi:LuxR family maltose regulon positive regulatory protein